MNHFYSVLCECVYCEAALLCCDRMTRHQIWRWPRERLVPWGLFFFFFWAKTRRALGQSTRRSASFTVARNLIHSRKRVKYHWRFSLRIEADLLAVAFMSSYANRLLYEKVQLLVKANGEAVEEDSAGTQHIQACRCGKDDPLRFNDCSLIAYYRGKTSLL